MHTPTTGNAAIVGRNFNDMVETLHQYRIFTIFQFTGAFDQTLLFAGYNQVSWHRHDNVLLR
jgi:hypothetical protein